MIQRAWRYRGGVFETSLYEYSKNVTEDCCIELEISPACPSSFRTNQVGGKLSKSVKSGSMLESIRKFASLRRKIRYGDRQKFDMLNLGIQQGEIVRRIENMEVVLNNLDKKFDRFVNEFENDK